MSSVLDGVRVLDLSSGIAGPIAGMLLSDHGASVIKVERPGGDPFRSISGARVWLRGRRSVELDLTDDDDAAVFERLVDTADVVLHSFVPSVAARLGLDQQRLLDRNPRLVVCALTPYGPLASAAERPGLEALVAARTGLQWLNRGNMRGIGRGASTEEFLPDLELPEGMEPGSARSGPIFNYSSWLSQSSALLAVAGISAALLARESTGRGQVVETSMLQGALAQMTAFCLRVERPDEPYFQSWIFDRRGPKGIFECSDGRWIQQWVPNPSFLLSSADGPTLERRRPEVTQRDDPQRIPPDPENLIVLGHYYPLMAEAVAKFPAAAWTELAEQAGVPLQPVRTPEEGLADEALIAEGAVVTVTDPDYGPLRQAGILYGLDRTPGRVQGPVPRPGQHNAEVRAEAAAARPQPAASVDVPAELPHGPLSGITVLDLGFAVAGPYATAILADLGATVIKVNARRDPWWHATHVAFGANRGKRSIGIDLKTEGGQEVLHRLVLEADVVHSNMRRDALNRLHCDEASLRAINPDLIYCHTRGFDRGPRSDSPGNDQTGACLAGVNWEDGGCADGGRPFWSLTSMGDTGNGLLSVIGVIQALLHRKRTGEAQGVDTSILNACLLTASRAAVQTDGSSIPRPHLDRMQLGLSATYRLYATSDGWLCLAVATDDQWHALAAAMGHPEWAAEEQFATVDGRQQNDKNLMPLLESAFLTRSADAWFDVLDAAGVPCEVSTASFVADAFDDPELRAAGLVVTQQHPQLGRFEHIGTLINFSDTPGTIWGPPPLVGQHTREILHEYGLDDEAIDSLVADQAVFETMLAG
jgi:crotonobetainyl-CoA:carnitine CoA-transferase CaiB-like acyl-CoA transferase